MRKRQMEKRQAKRFASAILKYWISEAWNELDHPNYSNLTLYDKQLIKRYIYRYECLIKIMLYCTTY